MTNEEAVTHLVEHMAIHKMNESRAIKVSMALQMAIRSLERQIPKKPKNVYIAQDKGIITYWECPRCKRRHRSDYFECATSYCDECGQKICWTEDEDDDE